MSILPILQVGHPTLRQSARALTTEELASERWQSFIDDLIDTMHAANGAGLAANQVGEPVRICAIHVSGGNPRYPYKPEIPLTVLVNATLTPTTGETFDNYEGCLSVPNLRGVVPRYTKARIDYLDRHGVAHTQHVAGLSAGTYQHELDHLDGKLFLDRVTDPTTLTTWDNFAEHHRDAFVLRVAKLVAKHGS